MVISCSHNQAVAATTWTISHGCGRYVIVQTYDSAGKVIEGEVTYVDSNTVTVEFLTAITGTAVCS